MIRFVFFHVIRVLGMRHVDGEGNTRRKTRGERRERRSQRIQHALQEVARGTFASGRANLFVIEETGDKAIVFCRLCTHNSFGNGMAAAQVVEPARINPFVVKATAICRLRIKQLHVKFNQSCARREFLFKRCYKQVLAFFRRVTFRSARPQRIKINLRIDLKAILVHATVQVNRQLRNPEKFFPAEQFRLERRAASIHVRKHPRIAKVAVKPAREKRRTVDLRMERTHARIYAIRIRRDPERREVRMCKRNPKSRRFTPHLRRTKRNDRSLTAHEISFCRLKIHA